MSSQRWSPPSSPDPDDYFVVLTDHRGMITDPTQSPSPSPLKPNEVKLTKKKKRRTLQYVSRHFVQPQKGVNDQNGVKSKKRKVDDEKENHEQNEDGDKFSEMKSKKRTRRKAAIAKELSRSDIASAVNGGEAQAVAKDELSTDVLDKKVQHSRTKQEVSPQNADDAIAAQATSNSSPPPKQPRIVLGINIDELSSDSDLTDVPDDIGPDPFLSQPAVKRRRTTRSKNAEVVAIKEPAPKSKLKAKKNNLTKSPYFPHAHKPRPTFLSTLPFPPLHHERFGLMQERLHRDPYRLLLATIFLNKTPGARAMPIFYRLMERYPTPQDLANAEQAHVTEIIQQLGFQNQRARKCIAMSKVWIQDPPVKGRRWRKLGYPIKGDGKDIKEGETIDDEDQRVAWEISHLPGLGPYSHDSWRMFCRDQLRGLSSGYDGQEAPENFEPEWKRVLPADKELRAWMTWMWMKEGWVWNKETGARTKASDELMELAREKGNVVLEGENNTLTVKALEETKSSSSLQKDVRVEVPAGDFLPQPDTGKELES